MHQDLGCALSLCYMYSLLPYKSSRSNRQCRSDHQTMAMSIKFTIPAYLFPLSFLFTFPVYYLLIFLYINSASLSLSLFLIIISAKPSLSIYYFYIYSPPFFCHIYHIQIKKYNNQLLNDRLFCTEAIFLLSILEVSNNSRILH